MPLFLHRLWGEQPLFWPSQPSVWFPMSARGQEGWLGFRAHAAQLLGSLRPAQGLTWDCGFSTECCTSQDTSRSWANRDRWSLPLYQYFPQDVNR